VLDAPNDSRFGSQGEASLELGLVAPSWSGRTGVWASRGLDRTAGPARATRHGANLRRARCGDRRGAARRAAGGDRPTPTASASKTGGDPGTPGDRADDVCISQRATPTSHSRRGAPRRRRAADRPEPDRAAQIGLAALRRRGDADRQTLLTISSCPLQRTAAAAPGPFDTRRLADRIDERIVTTTIDEDDRGFIERWTCSSSPPRTRGAAAVLVQGRRPRLRPRARRADDRVPVYDGNGMYLTAGNALVNPHVGLLFIDFERRRGCG
jgi:hypothetical protein